MCIQCTQTRTICCLHIIFFLIYMHNLMHIKKMGYSVKCVNKNGKCDCGLFHIKLYRYIYG